MITKGANLSDYIEVTYHIVDQVITMTQLKSESIENPRVFINCTNNPYNYPAKDRSGKLEMIEPAHLGNLMNKIKAKTIIN